MNTKYGYELCETHNVWRRIADVKVARVERSEREVDTPVYACLDGCPFIENLPKPPPPAAAAETLPPPNYEPARIPPRGHVPRSTPTHTLKKVNGSK